MAALSYDDLQRTIKAKGAALPAYYLHGEEDLLKDQAIRSLINSAIDPATRDFNVDRRRAGEVSAEEFQALALTSPMLAERRAVVVFEVEDLQQKRSRMQALRAAVLSYLEKPAGQTLLILVQSAGERPDADLARRTASVNCARLSPDKAAEWVRDRAAAQG
jgi:DNA polymerase-3 subunit delta